MQESREIVSSLGAESGETKRSLDIPKPPPLIFSNGSTAFLQEGLDPNMLVNNELKELNEFIYVRECQCCKLFTRCQNERTLRNDVDSHTTKSVQLAFPVEKHKTIVMLVLGAGELKQVLTTTAHLMQAGYHVELVLVDYQYKYLNESYRKYFDAKLYPSYYQQGKDDHGIRYSNPSQYIFGDDLEKIIVTSGTTLHKTFEQFEKVLKKLRTAYKRNVEIIGRFTSLEVFKSILTTSKCPIITRYGQKSSYAKDIAQMAGYAEEYERYQKICQDKYPHVVTIIDDLAELGDKHGPICDPTSTFNFDWAKLNGYRAAVYEIDIIRELCNIAKRDRSKTKEDGILFVSTFKQENLGINFDVNHINIQDVSMRKSMFQKNYESQKLKLVS